MGRPSSRTSQVHKTSPSASSLTATQLVPLEGCKAWVELKRPAWTDRNRSTASGIRNKKETHGLGYILRISKGVCCDFFPHKRLVVCNPVAPAFHASQKNRSWATWWGSFWCHQYTTALDSISAGAYGESCDFTQETVRSISPLGSEQ